MTGFDLPPDEVHLWRASLDLSVHDVSRLHGLLDEKEQARASRFRVPHRARRFIAARAALRTLLGRVTGTDPAHIDFTYGEHGKPAVARGPHFNASDTGDTVVVAMASSEIGVDVEGLRPLPNRDRFARRICTERELEALSVTADGEIDAALIRLWTFKEAALKAVGTGLPGGMRNVEVDFGPCEPPRLRRLREHHGGWTLTSTDLGHDLLCSVVFRGPERRLIKRELSLQSA